MPSLFPFFLTNAGTHHGRLLRDSCEDEAPRSFSVCTLERSAPRHERLTIRVESWRRRCAAACGWLEIRLTWPRDRAFKIQLRSKTIQKEFWTSAVSAGARGAAPGAGLARATRNRIHNSEHSGRECVDSET